jgi:hypothetical protein
MQVDFPVAGLRCHSANPSSQRAPFSFLNPCYPEPELDHQPFLRERESSFSVIIKISPDLTKITIINWVNLLIILYNKT